MSDELEPIINLGRQSMSGIFPTSQDQSVPSGKLELVKCMGDCGLVQSRYSFDRSLMYGENYGYESGINNTMKSHLENKIKRTNDFVSLKEGDLVVDIGSNDGTLLKFYPKNLCRVGIDPSSLRFLEQYKEQNINLYVSYFEDLSIINSYHKKAKVITSIAMFYDLENPIDFMMNIKNCLDKDGIWITEQSYMPSMLKNNSYDTICHEHVEYYSLTQINWMAKHVGLKIIDVSLNNINGGSFEVILCHEDANYGHNVDKIRQILWYESKFSELKPFEKFRNDVMFNRDMLIRFIKLIEHNQFKIFGYGASTKGNVILQYCGLNDLDIFAIADRNPLKWGKLTPGTNIPIISEEEARKKRPDFFLVLPWHFKKEIIEREKQYLLDGGRLIFPLPNMRIERILQ